jgi:hypothetical protein
MIAIAVPVLYINVYLPVYRLCTGQTAPPIFQPPKDLPVRTKGPGPNDGHCGLELIAAIITRILTISMCLMREARPDLHIDDPDKGRNGAGFNVKPDPRCAIEPQSR